MIKLIPKYIFAGVFCVFGVGALVAPVGGFQSQKQPSDEANDEKTDQWVLVKPSAARASIEMPTKPRFVERSFGDKGQPKVKVRLHIGTVGQDVSYIFGYHDLNEYPANSRVINATLDGAVKGSVSNVLGKLTGQPTKIRYKKNMGRSYQYRFVQGQTIFKVSSRLFLVGKRQYQLTCIMKEEVFDQEQVDKFMKSFRILPRVSDLPPSPE